MRNEELHNLYSSPHTGCVEWYISGILEHVREDLLMCRELQKLANLTAEIVVCGKYTQYQCKRKVKLPM
jgi:hypothetical protein